MKIDGLLGKLKLMDYKSATRVVKLSYFAVVNSERETFIYFLSSSLILLIDFNEMFTDVTNKMAG